MLDETEALGVREAEDDSDEDTLVDGETLGLEDLEVDFDEETLADGVRLAETLGLVDFDELLLEDFEDDFELDLLVLGLADLDADGVPAAAAACAAPISHPPA